MTTFDLKCQIEAFENGKCIFSRSFDKIIPRNFM
jgi:hypothetical protein